MNAINMRYSDNRNEVLDNASLYIDYVNSRTKIVSYDNLSVELLEKIVNFSKDMGLGKVLGYSKIRDLKFFKQAGFAIEGLINGFYRGEDAYCVSFFVNKSRSIPKRSEDEDAILELCFKKGKLDIPKKLNNKYKIRNCIENDIPQMVKLFKAVFKTYPSPVFDHEYLKEIINKKVLFKAALLNDKIISIASADMDIDNLNAEMTDCATYPEYRGQGLLSNLIYSLEEELARREFYTLYSLSRAINTGINMSLRQLGYNYSGRLVNNCNICGGYEDMNIWVKKLRDI